MSKISFILFTYNEEKRVEYAIRNFLSYGDVYVLDGGSTDKTKEISENSGAHFLLRPHSNKSYVETQENFDFIKNIIKTDWIYWGFVDNILPKSLLDKIVDVINKQKYTYVLTPIYSYLYGLTKYPMSKGYTPVFFRKDKIDFKDNQIHGMGKFLGDKREILRLPNSQRYAINHFSLYDLNKFLSNHFRYGDCEAQIKYSHQKKFNIFILFAAMIRYFFMYYRYSFKNGVRGFFTAIMYANFRLFTYIRLYEIENKINLDTIELEFIKSKEKILKEFE